ncbi:40S ribosomal protein S4-C [Zea mays]|nr:40S ribosomal protein S4-C [Zea mays]|eukprot:XP_008645604.1 40S ribosomal protein S4-C [Zea mays]
MAAAAGPYKEMLEVVNACAARIRWRLRPASKRRLLNDILFLCTGLRPVVLVDYGGTMPQLQENLCGLLYLARQFKLCKVRFVQFGQKGIPYLNTYDGRTIRYPDPLIKANDTIKIDLETNKIMDFIKLYLPFHRLHQVIYLVRLNVSTNS